ncbi:uncharacterized protein LOC110441072 [Mizuhopecten yessoensis]|uniref:Uncharacterized protein n=1 Tax=Mizuhopecten yessoensis TaxID=6573 RepID=A0A210PK15_MIZYE|nr:uncharacterized protein LOC110441072 [Mizuhopecten yessoensis]OWF36839.1 hypothetical protein KP79_PYT02784 [Mizuhopecten yessoensis]
MELFHRASLLVVGVCLLLEEGRGAPTLENVTERFRVQLEQSIFRTFDEFAQFLRSYFTRQIATDWESGELSSPEENPSQILRRRRAILPLRFEDVEREYLIKQSLQLLGQFVGYVEYVNNDNETRSYLEEILREHGDMLKTMSVAQLTSYLGTLQRTMEDGVNGQHQMVVNGKVFSLDHISSWCCQFG